MGRNSAPSAISSKKERRERTGVRAPTEMGVMTVSFGGSFGQTCDLPLSIQSCWLAHSTKDEAGTGLLRGSTETEGVPFKKGLVQRLQKGSTELEGV